MFCAKEMLLRAEMTGRMAAKYMLLTLVKMVCSVRLLQWRARILVN